MTRFFVLSGSLSGFVAVAAGAFGAHLLRPRLAARMFEVYEVAVRYQMYHALALLCVGWLCSRADGPAAPAAGWLFLLGSVVFSGSLYGWSLGGPGWLPLVTPLGGVALLAGWLAAAAAAWRAGPG